MATCELQEGVLRKGDVNNTSPQPNLTLKVDDYG